MPVSRIYDVKSTKGLALLWVPRNEPNGVNSVQCCLTVTRLGIVMMKYNTNIMAASMRTALRIKSLATTAQESRESWAR